jgi:hypothetical protein
VQQVYGPGALDYFCGPPLFNPRTIPGLELWLDASDASTFTQIGGRVLTWRDKSGSGRHATNLGMGQPRRVQNSVNGRPSVSFDGVDDYLEVSPAFDWSRMSLFVVLRVENPDLVPYPAPVGTNPVDSGYGFLIGDENKPKFRVLADADPRDARDSAPVDATAEVWAGVFDEMRVRMFRNGSEVGALDAFGSLPANPGMFRIGDGAQNAFQGYIAEIIAYDSALSPDDHQRVTEYLSCKYQVPFQAPSWVVGLASHNLDRALRIEVSMDYGLRSYAYLLEPAAPVNRLLIFHQGHDHDILQSGGQRTLEYFLDRGFSILTFWMPLYGENLTIAQGVPGHGDVELDGHYSMWNYLEDEQGSYLRFFVNPVLIALNYAQTEHSFVDVCMIGVSGGGWTTTLCAAVDPRIRTSFPVAGSLPLYLTSGPCANGSQGDWEQRVPQELYDGPECSYLDLYILGSYGRGRRQIQILNQFDPCCYGGVNYQTYEPHVVNAVSGLGFGSYSVHLDASHTQHAISEVALDEVIKPALSAPVPTSVDAAAGGSVAMHAAPNPFRGTTAITYNVPQASRESASRAHLVVYDVSGRRVATLVDGLRMPGVHQAIWNGRDDRGRALAAGVYWYRLRVGDRTLDRSVTLLR